jgi:NADH:ubiquinone reductase (H+-translocating)
MQRRQRVVVVGSGFGGLSLMLKLQSAPVDITLVDRRNYHLFQPLLYQVATAALSSTEIAHPTRSIFRNARNVTVLLDEAVGVDLGARKLLLRDNQPLEYDVLVLATGVEYDYFGHPEWRHVAPSLKDLSDAQEIRRRLLLAFEHAESCPDAAEQRRLLTCVMVGGGPTGVELAGSIAELARFALRRDFRNIDPRSTRVVLLEAGPRILAGFPTSLSAYATRALERMGVEVRTNSPVRHIDATGVSTDDAHIASTLVVWCAGVRGGLAGDWFGGATARNGRLPVEPDLSVADHPEIFVLGDVAAATDRSGQLLPQLASVAKQQGSYVARAIKARLEGRTPAPFRYKDPGALAIIGRSAAVVDFGAVRLTGFAGWLVWVFAHILFLIGFRNRIAVFLDWAWEWLTYARGARLIVTPRQ